MLTSSSVLKSKPSTLQTDLLPLYGTDHIEMYVGNAKQAAHFYKSALGFQSLAFAGLETGLRDRESYVVHQGKIKIVLTAPLKSDSAISRHLERHGDGVKAIAFEVDDARKAFEDTVDRGAKPFLEPFSQSDEHGTMVRSGIHTYGDTVHLFIERKNYTGIFLPNFKEWNPVYTSEPIGLQYIDHIVGNVELGRMNEWVQFYKEILGFKQIISFDDKDISTDYTSLMSKVMSNGNGRIKFPINEPAAGIKKSQIDEYLQFYEGPGVQHLALATNDIIHTVRELNHRGIEFLQVPDSYYDGLKSRVGNIEEDMATLRKLNILVDRDDEGYLLQIFTKPIVSRPTLFFEIIQRKGATSFGKGNFKALFEAIEREQAKRGTL